MVRMIAEGALREWIRKSGGEIDFYERLDDDGKSYWIAVAILGGEVVEIVKHYDHDERKTWRKVHSALDFQARVAPDQQLVRLHRYRRSDPP